MRRDQGTYTQEPQLLLFRRRLASRMIDLDLDTVELAEAVGQTRQCVSAWLSGIRLPQPVSLIRLARALEVPVDWLLGEDVAECGRRAIHLNGICRRTPATAVAGDAEVRRDETLS